MKDLIDKFYKNIRMQLDKPIMLPKSNEQIIKDIKDPNEILPDGLLEIQSQIGGRPIRNKQDMLNAQKEAKSNQP